MVKSISQIKYNLSLLDERNAKVNTALGTKEALEYGSDNAVLYSQILNIQNDKNGYTAISQYITLSQAFNTISDDTMAEVKNTTQSVIGDLLEANNDTTAQSQREIIATQLEDYRNSLLALANTNVNGQYIFSGVNTSTIPFIKDANGVISYQSDNSTRKVNVEDATYTAQGINGIKAFYYVNNEVSSGAKYEYGSTFTVDSTETIVDQDGNSWQFVDTTIPADGTFDGLYMNGDTSTTPISIVDNGDGTITITNDSPSTELNITSDGESFTFTTNEIILDKDENEWKLMDTDNDGTFDGLYMNGDTTTTPITVTDNGDGTITTTNTSTVDLDVYHSVFDDLTDAINALRLVDNNGNTITKVEQRNVLTNVIDKMNDAYESQNIAHSLVGTRTSTINAYANIVSSKVTNLKILEEKYASADLTSLAIEAKALESTYTAMYATISRLNSMSLVKYLS
ncbi:hypothetical protein [Halarcobacter ebronensis]|uniref:Flagellin N-terminal domain-containing protein n=1 Tax=Halarcobacter ebronensis TaxID=1462615 RepID=A0A4Q1AJ65_9BACT|nr:hypothetical protein [Halarcobacter ebronensis]QKF82082.1 distal flagellar hook-filament junction protein [Halarcobacter ebronensis]RXK04087.1 hypothetical protein CRV07_11710 [Halarcobacter ebronensis]